MSRMVFCRRMAGCGKDNLIMASKKTGQLHQSELLSCVAIAFCYSTSAITFLNPQNLHHQSPFKGKNQ